MRILYIDLYLPGLHGVGKMGVLRLTGPSASTLAIAPLLAPHRHRFISDESPFPLKYSIYDYDSHIGVFKSHYSKLITPVVKINAIRKMLSAGVDALNKVDAPLKRKLAVVFSRSISAIWPLPRAPGH